MRAYLLAACAVLPLLAPHVWTGFRVGTSDIALSVLTPSEQPLSVRSPGGLWAAALTATWFALAYRRRDAALWEVALVVAGGAVALARAGNLWVAAAALLVPLGRQLAAVQPSRRVYAAVAGGSLLVALGSVLVLRPPPMPAPASQAALAAAAPGAVLADWRWAAELRHRVGDGRQVLASGGLATESFDFWLDYLRVAQGHARWADILRQLDVDLVVLDAADQQHAAADLIRGSTDWQVTYDAGGALVARRIGP